MYTIAKIARITLLRILTSEKYFADEVIFSTETLDLLTHPEACYVERENDTSPEQGVSYYVWGIELGLRELDTGLTSFMDNLAQFVHKHNNPDEYTRIDRAVLPSHIISYHWYCAENRPDLKNICTVFRFTVEQNRLIREFLPE